MDIGEALHAHRVLAGAAEAEEVGERRLAFEDQNGAALHAAVPFDAGGGPGACHEDVRHPGGLTLEADGGENLGPRAGVVGEHAEVGQFGGGGQGGEEQKGGEEPAQGRRSVRASLGWTRRSLIPLFSE